MTLEQDWGRVTTTFKKAKELCPNPNMFLFAHIEELRRLDNKGIDFAIRRLRASSEYGQRIRLYGGPSSSFPRYPLRCYDPMFGMMRHYILIGIPEFRVGINNEEQKT